MTDFLSIKNLNAGIGEKTILHDLNLEINPGETHVLMGPNGAGKSTLGYTLMGSPEYKITGGKIIVNTQEIDPMPVITGAMEYPKNIGESLSKNADVTFVDALELAQKAGNFKAVNVVLIGVMAKSTDIAYEKWVETIRQTVPPKFLEVNLAAFEYGYNL